MTNNCNKLLSIHKKGFKLKFFFCAMYILLSAKVLCSPLNKSETIELYDQSDQLKKNQLFKQSVLNEQPILTREGEFKKINSSKKDISTFTSLLGEATILQLDDYSFGIFRLWPNQELFIVKLSLNIKSGWIEFLKINQESFRIRIDYDRSFDGRIIKIDPCFLKILHEELGQSPDWNNVLFLYKQPFNDQTVFIEKSLTSTIAFERKICKKISTSSFKDGHYLSLISSEIYTKGRIAPYKLKNIDQIGLILIKNANYLGSLIKNILGTNLKLTDLALQPNKVIDHPQNYIIFPATLITNTLVFNSQNLNICEENRYASFCFKKSVPLYCYIKDKSYNRLIQLKNVRELIKTDNQLPNPLCYYYPTTYYPLTLVQRKEQVTTKEPTIDPNTKVYMDDDLQDESVVIEKSGVPFCEEKIFELPMQDKENHFNAIIASEESLLYLNLLVKKDAELAKLQAEEQEDHKISEIDYEYESRLADLCFKYKNKDYIQTLFSQYLFDQMDKKNKALAFFDKKHKQRLALKYESDKKELLSASALHEQHQKKLDSLENSMNELLL